MFSYGVAHMTSGENHVTSVENPAQFHNFQLFSFLLAAITFYII